MTTICCLKLCLVHFACFCTLENAQLELPGRQPVALDACVQELYLPEPCMGVMLVIIMGGLRRKAPLMLTGESAANGESP
jgi:hypothetical protein